MTKKQIACSIGFILSACVLLFVLCDLFEIKNTGNADKRFNTFRSLEKDTVDAVIIGTSGIDRYWISPKAYEEYGMTVYTLATDGQPSWLFENVLEEVFAYQNPELVILDIRAFGSWVDPEDESRMDARARRVLDSLRPLTLNRLKAGLKTIKFFHENYEGNPKFDISYLLSVVKYHEEWSSESYSIEDNLFNKLHDYLGFFISDNKKTVYAYPHEYKVYDMNNLKPMDPVIEREFYDLMDYLEDKDCKVLFLLTPNYMNKGEMGRMNTFMSLLEKEGLDYINYCETDENGVWLYDLQLDPANDFYNGGHVNYYGAEKFTRVFAKYLDENYDLPDRREEEAVKEQWDGVYDKLKTKISKMEEKENAKE